jgi:hypothetical protein
MNRRAASRQTPDFLSRRQQKVSKKCLSPAVGMAICVASDSLPKMMRYSFSC